MAESASEKLRLALNRLARSQGVLVSLDNQLATGALGMSAHARARARAIREFYAAKAGAAHAYRAARKRLKKLEDELVDARSRQERLGERLERARITAEAANAENRRIVALRKTIEAEILELGRLLNEPPMTAPAAPPGALERGLSSAEVFLSYLSPIVAALAVFLPWVQIEQDSFSMMSLGAAFMQAGAISQLPPLSLQLLWLPYFLAPLPALPFLRWRAPRAGGVALLFAGCLAFAGSVAPMLLLAVRADMTALGLLGAVRPGAWAYLVASAMMISLGARRLDSARGTRRSSGIEVAAVIAAAGAVAVAVVVCFQMAPLAGSMAFSGEPTDERGVIHIHLENGSGRQVAVVVPWVDKNDPPPVAEGIAVRGLRAYVREPGSKAFRLLPIDYDLWVLAGFVGVTPAARLEPGEAIDVYFDTSALGDQGIAAQAVRIELVDVDGDVLDSFEANIEPKN